MKRHGLWVVAVVLLLAADAPKKPNVGQIIIIGNEYTRQYIILRQLPFKPGAELKQEDLKKAKQNLARLGLFKASPKIEVLNDPDNATVVDVMIMVQEKEENDPPIKLAGQTARDAAAKDTEKLQGKWEVVSARSTDGVKEDEAKFATWVFLFSPKGLVLSDKDRRDEVAFRLDATNKPKAIDFGDGKDLIRGIYELDGDTLKICMNDKAPRPRRPGGFDGKQDGLMILTLKRMKP